MAAENDMRRAVGDNQAVIAKHDHAVDHIDQPVEAVIDDQHGALRRPVGQKVAAPARRARRQAG
ncbi:MAG: hypothetical protein RIM80_22685, partial [Alphaproteobacteria bacterium]